MANRLYLEDLVKQKEIRIKERQYDLEGLLVKISETQKRPSFYKAISKEGLSIIGEVKKASPSKGLIKPDFNPVEIAKEYEKAVDAISVLTEEDFFLGKDDYLRQISEQVSLPTLCKDFIMDPNQIYSAKALGASAVLLIVAILTDSQLIDFLKIAHRLELDALVEVHSREELDVALSAGVKIVGINNRDLKTFKTNIETTIKLRKYIPKEIIVVSESGINCVEDIKRLKEASIDGILVGESFMRSKDIYNHAKELKDAYKN